MAKPSWPHLRSRTIKQFAVSSADHGGGKRRAGIAGHFNRGPVARRKGTRPARPIDQSPLRQSSNQCAYPQYGKTTVQFLCCFRSQIDLLSHVHYRMVGGPDHSVAILTCKVALSPQQVRQLGEVSGDVPSLVAGQALSRCDGNLGAVSPQKEPQAEYATHLGLGLLA